jgi:hypothetical protein
MPWYKQRVWQMGVGTLIVLLGAFGVYTAAADEPVQTGLMWFGLVLIFFGLAVPLLTRLIEAQQEKEGERGES